MLDFLNAVPVVGHAKGAVHYATKNKKAGNKAMKEATRSSAVMTAGAVGCVAGPVGAAAMGALAGAAWDSVETVATGQSTGFIKGVENIAETASKGKMPVNEILLTTVNVGADAFGGVGGGCLATSVSSATGQVAANTIGKSVGRSAGQNIVKSASVSAGQTFGKAAAQSVGKSIGKSVTQTVAKGVVKNAIIEEVVAQTTYAFGKSAANVLYDKLQQLELDSGGSGSESSSTKTNGSSNRTDESSTRTGSSSSGTGASSTRTGTSSTGTGASSTRTGVSATGTGAASIETEGTSSGTGAAGSRQKPLRKNPNQTTCSQQTPESYTEEFLTPIGLQSLDQMSIRGQYIYRDLKNSQTAYALMITIANFLQNKIQQSQQDSGGSDSGNSSTKTSAASTETATSSTGTDAPSTEPGGTSSSSGSSGNGQQPPIKNPNQTTSSQQTEVSYLQELLTAFGVQKLGDISIRDQHLFSNLACSYITISE